MSYKIEGGREYKSMNIGGEDGSSEVWVDIGPAPTYCERLLGKGPCGRMLDHNGDCPLCKGNRSTNDPADPARFPSPKGSTSYRVVNDAHKVIGSLDWYQSELQPNLRINRGRGWIDYEGDYPSMLAVRLDLENIFGKGARLLIFGGEGTGRSPGGSGTTRT